VPILDLRPDCLNKPSRLDLARIEVVMLWPQDETQRARALEAAAVQSLGEMVEQLGADETPVAITVSDLKALTRRILGAPRLTALQQEVRRPFTRGLVAGLLLYEVVGWASLNPAIAGLGRVKAHIVKRRIFPRVSVKTIDNIIWPSFKPVAHLWAAYQSIRLSTRDVAFPCRIRDLQEFLSTAESFRQAGERLKPKQARETILDPNKTWRPPSTIVVPAIDLDFERVDGKVF
jgi:hypothetical protein